MSVYEIVFSPTRGTKKAADLFTESFSSPSTYIDLLGQKKDFSVYSFQPQDICIISVPVYGGRVSGIAALCLGR